VNPLDFSIRRDLSSGADANATISDIESGPVRFVPVKHSSDDSGYTSPFTTFCELVEITSDKRSSLATQIVPFGVEDAEWFAKVVDQDNQPVAGAMVVTVQGVGAVGSRDGAGRPQLAASQASVR
jgi:hypothetical protein